MQPRLRLLYRLQLAHTTSHLADGCPHLPVQATDLAANADPTPASRTFTVHTTKVRVSGSTLVVTAGPAAEPPGDRLALL